MIQVEKTIKFNTTSEEKGNQIMKAFVSMLNNLSGEDIIYIGELSARKRNWVAKAKPYEKFL